MGGPWPVWSGLRVGLSAVMDAPPGHLGVHCPSCTQPSVSPRLWLVVAHRSSSRGRQGPHTHLLTAPQQAQQILRPGIFCGRMSSCSGTPSSRCPPPEGLLVRAAVLTSSPACGVATMPRGAATLEPSLICELRWRRSRRLGWPPGLWGADRESVGGGPCLPHTISQVPSRAVVGAAPWLVAEPSGHTQNLH